MKFISKIIIPAIGFFSTAIIALTVNIFYDKLAPIEFTISSKNTQYNQNLNSLPRYIYEINIINTKTKILNNIKININNKIENFKLEESLVAVGSSILEGNTIIIKKLPVSQEIKIIFETNKILSIENIKVYCDEGRGILKINSSNNNESIFIISLLVLIIFIFIQYYQNTKIKRSKFIDFLSEYEKLIEDRINIHLNKNSQEIEINFGDKQCVKYNDNNINITFKEVELKILEYEDNNKKFNYFLITLIIDGYNIFIDALKDIKTDGFKTFIFQVSEYDHPYILFYSSYGRTGDFSIGKLTINHYNENTKTIRLILDYINVNEYKKITSGVKCNDA